jgi:hypothetical protein
MASSLLILQSTIKALGVVGFLRALVVLDFLVVQDFLVSMVRRLDGIHQGKAFLLVQGNSLLNISKVLMVLLGLQDNSHSKQNHSREVRLLSKRRLELVPRKMLR